MRNLLFGLVVLVVLVALSLFLSDTVSFGAVQRYADNLGVLGPVFILLLAIAQVFLAVVPSPLLLVLSIALYGSIGAILGYVALFVSSIVGYGVGRWAGAGIDVQDRWVDLVNRYGALGVLVTRASPLLSMDAVSIASGALKMSTERFVIATLIGLVPLCALAFWYGRSVTEPNALLVVYTVVLLVGPLLFVVWDRNREP